MQNTESNQMGGDLSAKAQEKMLAMKTAIASENWLKKQFDFFEDQGDIDNAIFYSVLLTKHLVEHKRAVA